MIGRDWFQGSWGDRRASGNKQTYLKTTSGFQQDVVLKINLAQMNRRWECFSRGLMEGHWTNGIGPETGKD